MQSLFFLCLNSKLRLLLVTAIVIIAVNGVDRSNFKTCNDSSFCKRNREISPNQSPYNVVDDSISIQGSKISFDIKNQANDALLAATVAVLRNGKARLRIKEKNPMYPRYEVEDILIKEPDEETGVLANRDDQGIQLNFRDKQLILTLKPFRIDFLVNNTLVISVNSRGLMNFENYRKKHKPADESTKEGSENSEAVNQVSSETEDVPAVDENLADKVGQRDEELKGLWEETFKSHSDSKPKGPSSVGLDFSFPGVEHVYGIPEHADSLALKSTSGGDPYRLYNLDVFEYEIDNPMALYGSIPFMLAHCAKSTVGLFWMNAAETWIDIDSNKAKDSILSRFASMLKGNEEMPQIDTHWFSESGIIDVFFMFGPRPNDVFEQYASLTGPTYLPPLFAIAYHQSRWNYNDEEDVRSVDSKFDEHDIPYDVLWLDIEHTDGKKYFTWDSTKFPNPEDMQKSLAAKGRKMVTIVDPHIKRDSGYGIDQDASNQGRYVKNKDDNVYEGWCWPGSSSWIDFINPEHRDWWASRFNLDNYPGSTNSLFIWNDMNEPSVFNGPEITMHKDAKHFGGWEHRDVHNIFGLYAHKATADGLIARSGFKERPFVLSRAFFAGSQRFGAIWTGDNTASWEHLKISLPMIMSISIAGLPFAGADVGGFFKNPDEELLVRWYQTASYQPFFRAHAHIDTRRREPWLLAEANMNIVRDAIRTRYALLPFWYTLFYQASVKGGTIIRPLFTEYPEDVSTFAMSDEYLIGSDLLVKPITDASASSTSIYLPGNNELWYDIENYKWFTGPRSISMSVSLNKIPVFQRGGSIVPRKERIRRCSSLMYDDPYTLTVALNRKAQALGQLYIDDGHSFDYSKGEFSLRKFTYEDNVLSSRPGSAYGNYKTNSWLEKIVVLGMKNKPSKISVSGKNSTPRKLKFKYDRENRRLTVKKPEVNIVDDWEINFKF
ncbi:uncharacterized protein TRIADDRAFT_37096 [Trichoplax adhaerens]|uniref:Neutral alpha-glucosidase AB n=1 Tax=Trichoplax adhaerens TaxID=10228 RepID=B3RJS4_TRIAD|nr:hypothetical protein TRIADDRAFT_37096 [Trichoplax adhaerens]EDV29833.1 hypothetical protein TRIADDRAFT_37096 [Trichoplax adhaerens]|eukprot:XP_002109035.1 hypothetical protein TRIADDRAFT_37096 [Trichoplax adhaerens]